MSERKRKPNNYIRTEIAHDSAFLKALDDTTASEKNKEIFRRYISGESYKELSEAFGYTPKNIRQRIVQTRCNVAKYIKHNPN